MLNISLRPWKPASRPALKPASRLASSLKTHPRGLEVCLEACLEACFMLKNIFSRSGSLPRSLSGGLHHAITNPRSLGGLPRGLPRSLPGSLLDADKHIYFRCFEASMGRPFAPAAA